MIPLRHLYQSCNRWLAVMAIISMLAVVPRAMQGQPVVYDPHPRDLAMHRLVLDDGTNNGFWGILRLTGTLTNDIYIDFPADATGPVIRGHSTGGQSITGGLTVDDLALSTPLSPIYGGTGFSSYAIGDILYANSPTTLARRAIGTTGQVLVVDGGVPQWSNSDVFSSVGGSNPVTGINSGDITAGLPEAITNIGYNDGGGANEPSTTNIAGNTNIGSATGDDGGPTTTTVNGNANFTGTTTFAIAPTIPLATDNLWVGVGGVQTAYPPGAAGTVLTVVGTTPTWSATIGSSSAPENVLGGPLNLNSSAAGSPSTTNINASPATGGTTNIGNGTSTTNVAGTTNLTGPATLSGATTTISSPTTNINTAPNAGGTTTIGNPTSTTTLNGTVNFTNPPTIPLNQNAMWVGNASNVQAAYNSTNVNGAVLAQNASGTPTWTTSTVLAATTGSAPVTNINNGDVNNGSGTESVTNIGYNDPDGGAAANAASQTNILGNTSLGSNTGSGGGPTTTTVLGTTNLQGATTNINTAPNAGGTTTIGNPTSTTQLNGTVNFANAPTIPLNQNSIWVGNASNQQQAYASTNVNGAVLAQNASGTPVWSSTNNFTTTAPAAGGATTNINNGDVNSGNNSEATTNIGYNDPDGATATNAASQTNIYGNTNLGSNTGSGGGPTTTTVLGTTNLQGATTNINTAPNAGGTTTIGNPTSTTQLNGTVNFANAPTIPLNQNSIWVGNASNQQQAYASTNVNGAVLAQDASGTPVWSSTNNFTTTAPAAGGATTNINNGDVNSGNNSEATTNIGYNDPDGATATNAASQTNILGNTNLGSNTGSGGGPTTTTVLGTTNLQGSTTNINTAPNAGGTTTIGNPTSTTQLNGTVNFANAPTIPLATDNLWVGVGGVQTAYPPGAAGSVLSIVGTTPTWSSANVLNAQGGLAPVTSINAQDNNVGAGTEAVTLIGYNDPSSGGADNPSTTNIRGNTNVGSNTGDNGGATTTNILGNTNINASQPNSPNTQTTTIGYNDPDGAGANVPSVTNILGTTNLSGSTNNVGTTDNTPAGGPESQITLGYNDPDGAGPNGPSSTTINGNVSFGTAPTIPLNQNSIWVGNASNQQQAYASTNVSGAVLAQDASGTPVWSSTNNFITTAPAAGGATTNINSGDVNSGNNSEATTNIGYNDPDGATATNAASQTNIYGNTNLGSNTGSGGGATTTNVVGNTNINASNPGSSVVQTTTVGYNDPDGAGANAASQTTVLGNINLNSTSPGSTSPQTTTIGYNDPDAGGGNVPSQTTILGNTNINATNPNSPTAQVTTIGYNDPDGAGPNSASSTVFNGDVTFTNPPSLPLATNNLFVGVGGVATALPPTNSSVFVTDGSGVPQWQTIASFLPATAWALTGNAGTTPASQYLGTTDDQDVSFRTNGTERARMYSNTNGGGFGIANAFRPGGLAGSTGQMLASTGSTTAPVWTPSGVLNAVGGTTPVTGVNSGDINNGSGTESVTNIGYTDPDGNTAANGASTTNMLGDVNINTTGPAGTRTTPQTTTIGYNDPDGVGTGVASQTTILGNTNIGSSTGPTTTTFSGNVVFNTAPSIPLATNNLFVGVGGVATALPPTNSSVFVTDGSGVPQWQTIASFLPATAWALAGNAGTTPASQYLGTTDDQDVSFRTNGTERARMYSNTNGGGFGITNAFRPGGLAGSTGQVLTSTGSSTAPVWTSSSVLSSVGGSTPVTAINNGDINNGSGTESVTNIGYNDPDGNTASNGPSTTNVLGDINLNATNPNKGAPQTTTIGYNDPDGGAGNVPSQTTINGNTNINAGPVNSPNTQTTTIGYNDPDGGGTGVASTTNILGNTNIGSATGPTTTTFFGNVVLPSGTTLPLPTNNIFVGVANVATALPPVNSAVLVTDGSGVPQWQTIATFAPNNWSLLGNTGTTPGVGVGQNFMGSTDDRDVVLATNNTERARVLSTTNGGGFRISNAFLPNGLAGSNGQVLTSTGSSTAPAWTSSSVLSSVGGSTPTTGINTGDINPGTGSGEAVTNIGYNDPDGGGPNGPSTTNIAGNTNIGSATGPTTTTFFGNVVLPSGTTLPLAQNNIFVGNASNNAAAVAPGSVGSVLTVNASSTPTWITTNVLSATAGATPLTGINSSDVNPGTNTESTTNIGYNDPDGATATNGPSVTNIRGNTTIGSATGNGGGPTTTTINGDMVFGNPGAIRNALGIYSGRVANSTGSNTTTVTVTGATFTANTVIEISWEEAGAGTSTYLQYKVVNRSGVGGNQFTVSFSAIPPAGFINYIVHQ
ncbi:MAG: hypothetical protein IPM61_00985 [Chlorobi bacterium]|nr:hypothetical protein [Chlorobiota bacterium]